MKLNIKIDTNVSEPEALIVTPKMNEEVSKIVDFIEKLKIGRASCRERV